MKVLIVGAGVSGLSCALRLLQGGHTVEIWARDLPQDTTSSVAAALWFPFLAEPVTRVLPWSATTFRELVQLSALSETGIIMRDGCEIFREHRANEAWWATAVDGYRRARADELPEGFVDGYFARVPIIDMSIYLGWLEQQVRDAGARIVQRSISSFHETVGAAEVVINCSGVAARELVHDRAVIGVRGQVQIVHAPHVTRYLLDDTGPTYIIPRVNDVVLGGTADEHVYETTVSDETASALRARCVALMPELANAPVLRNKVGIRPCRSTVRVDEEHVDGVRIIHNYGHGGSGVTISWGCADEVVSML